MENNTNKKNTCPEESSWTFYIQGFMHENDDDVDADGNSYCLSSDDQLEESPSLVSDAASSAIKNHNSNNKLMSAIDDDCKNNLGFCSGKTSDVIPRRSMCKENILNCKKLKSKVVPPSMENYDLEDTASSPVNSPKIVCMNQFMGQKQKDKKHDHRPR